MKGLCLQSWYAARGSLKLFLCALAALGVALLLTGSPTALELFVFLAASLPLTLAVGVRRDAASQWMRYSLSLPVRRADLIRCKYLTHLLGAAAGLLLALLAAVLIPALHGLGPDLPSTFALGAGISLLTGALYHPALLLVGWDKSETVLLLSLLSAIGLTIALPYGLRSLGLGALALVLVCLAVFALSYLLAQSLFSHKEL